MLPSPQHTICSILRQRRKIVFLGRVMEELWPYVSEEITKLYINPQRYEDILINKKIKYALHTIFWTSETLPKRIELGDAHECNPYHLFFYMIARFYYFDNGGDIHYYYPNKYNNYFPEKALACLPPRFKREFEKTPGYEYFEMPACKWYATVIDEPWMYPYIRDLYKHIWDSTTQVKGKYTYISRNPRDVKGRRIFNEDELIEPLKRKGFSSYVLDTLTFEDQIRLFRSSEIITGMHGAGMTWLLFCEPGTLFLEIAIPGGTEKHREHYEHICITCNLPYYRYLRTIPCDITQYPDAKEDDCLIDPADYTTILDCMIQTKNQKEAI